MLGKALRSWNGPWAASGETKPGLAPTRIVWVRTSRARQNPCLPIATTNSKIKAAEELGASVQQSITIRFWRIAKAGLASLCLVSVLAFASPAAAQQNMRELGAQQ